MKIKVIYPDGKEDEVYPPLLSLLIERKRIRMFYRSDGWVIVGKDPVRKGRSPGSPGSERRIGQLPVKEN